VVLKEASLTYIRARIVRIFGVDNGSRGLTNYSVWEDEIVDEFDCAAAKTTFCKQRHLSSLVPLIMITVPVVKGNYQSCIYSEENVQRLRYAFEAGHQVASSGWR
jgi:hypothetical protein